MAEDHNAIIAAAAGGVLAPLGFQRKGRSRLWFGDHGWWLTVVEFQPSGFSKGSSLNVAAHWLWVGEGIVSFDYVDETGETSRSVGWAEFGSEGFRADIEKLAEDAAREALRLEHRFPSIEATAKVLLDHERSVPAQARGGWSALHAGVAAGLADHRLEAATMLNSVTDERITPIVDRYLDAVDDPVAFKAVARALVNKEREALGLPAARMEFR